MTRNRQRRTLTIDDEPFLTVRSVASNLPGGYLIGTHAHPWHQLLCTHSGAMTVYSGRSSWITPPGKAVFIPASRKHSIRMWGNVAVRSLYFQASLASPALEAGDCHVFSATPLLRELVLRVIEHGALDSRISGHQSLLNVLLDEMMVAPETPLMLPLPSDPRALAVAHHFLTDPSCSDTLATVSRRSGASRRTLERLFQAETGLSFGVWRQKARLLDAIRLLAEGKTVTDAALDTGYASMSAFISAFKKTFGYTPGRLA